MLIGKRLWGVSLVLGRKTTFTHAMYEALHRQKFLYLNNSKAWSNPEADKVCTDRGSVVNGGSSECGDSVTCWAPLSDYRSGA